MEISYGLDFVYQAVGKLYLDNAAISSRLAALEDAQRAEPRNPVQSSVGDVEPVEPSETAPVDQGGPEPSNPVSAGEYEDSTRDRSV